MIEIKRLSNESARQFCAMRSFAQMGLGRRLSKLAQAEDIFITTLRSWSARFHWRDRIEDYDLRLIDLEQKAQREALTSRVANWTARRAEIREQEYQLSLKLMQRAREILDNPRIFVNFPDAIRAMEVAIEPGRRACGMNDGPQGPPPPFSDQELDLLLERAYGQADQKLLPVPPETQLTNTAPGSIPSQNTVPLQEKHTLFYAWTRWNSGFNSRLNNNPSSSPGGSFTQPNRRRKSRRPTAGWPWHPDSSYFSPPLLRS